MWRQPKKKSRIISKNNGRRNSHPSNLKYVSIKCTEQPFTGRYYDFNEDANYKCVCCGNDLFRSDAKFDSGTGWSSFWTPIKDENIKEQLDDSFFMRRIEVMCNKCGARLGHVFNDSPKPTGLRYCINSASTPAWKEVNHRTLSFIMEQRTLKYKPTSALYPPRNRPVDISIYKTDQISDQSAAKQVARVQNDIQRIRTAPITKTNFRKLASSTNAPVKPRSKKNKLLKGTKVKRSRRKWHNLYHVSMCMIIVDRQRIL